MAAPMVVYRPWLDQNHATSDMCMVVAFEQCHISDSKAQNFENVPIWWIISAVVTLTLLIWRNSQSLTHWEPNEEIFLQVANIVYWFCSALVAPFLYLPELQLLTEGTGKPKAGQTDKASGDSQEGTSRDVSTQTRGPAHDAICNTVADITTTLVRTNTEILNTERRIRRMTSNYFLRSNRVRARCEATSEAICRTYSHMVGIQKQAEINEETANTVIRRLLYQRIANGRMSEQLQQTKNSIIRWTPKTKIDAIGTPKTKATDRTKTSKADRMETTTDTSKDVT